MIHITSAYLKFYPVITRLASELGIGCRFLVDKNEEGDGARSRSLWMMVSHNQALLNSPEIYSITVNVPLEEDIPVWTDDYSSLLQVLWW